MLSRKAVKNHSLWWWWHLIAGSGCIESAGEEEDWESKKPWWHHNLRSEGFVINDHADCPLLEKQADQISSRSKLRDFQALRCSIRVAENVSASFWRPEASLTKDVIIEWRTLIKDKNNAKPFRDLPQRMAQETRDHCKLTIENLTEKLTDLTIKSETGQHSQFWPCFIEMEARSESIINRSSALGMLNPIMDQWTCFHYVHVHVHCPPCPCPRCPCLTCLSPRCSCPPYHEWDRLTLVWFGLWSSYICRGIVGEEKDRTEMEGRGKEKEEKA